MTASKTYTVKVNPAPPPAGGSTDVSVNGHITTVPLGTEVVVSEEVYEALQNSAYDVTVVDGAGGSGKGSSEPPATTVRHTDVPLDAADGEGVVPGKKAAADADAKKGKAATDAAVAKSDQIKRQAKQTDKAAAKAREDQLANKGMIPATDPTPFPRT